MKTSCPAKKINAIYKCDNVVLVFFDAQIFRPADSDKISKLADLAHHPKSFEDRWFIGLISKFAKTRLKHLERKQGASERTPK